MISISTPFALAAADDVTVPAADALSLGCIAPRPVAFDHCLGMYHTAEGRTGIVMCGPWGYEDLVIRAAWRDLAERLAAAGFPCLRFEYPATGNSLGDPDAVTFADWVATARRACDLLAITGVTQIVLLGHGLGTIVARAAAADQPCVAGLVLMAPTSARRFLRETTHLAAMLARVEDIASAKSARLAIAGFVMPPRIVADLKAMPASPSVASGLWTLLAEPGERCDKSFAHALVDAGATLERLPYPGYEALVGDPTTSVVPVAAFASVVDALRRRFSEASVALAPSDLAAICPARLVGADFREEAVVFGEGSGLFGVLCAPARPQRRAIVLLLNTGRNPHTGWRRMTVDHARALAAAGIASLRFDVAGVGESARDADRPKALMFSSHAVVDVVAACDMVSARGYDDITVAGICSGAYLGLLASVADRRIRRLIAINLPRFSWGRGESIEAAIRFANRPAAHRLGRLLDRNTLRLILAGRLDPRPAVGFKLRAIARRLSLKAAPLIRRLSPHWDVYGPAHTRMRALAKRGVQVVLGYGQNDGGWGEFELLFGRNGRRLPGRATTTIDRIDGIDHNLTQDHACDWLLAHIVAAVATPSHDQV